MKQEKQSNEKLNLDDARFHKLDPKQALELMNVSDEVLKELKNKPIKELKFLEAIATKRKTEYLENINKEIKDFRENPEGNKEFQKQKEEAAKKMNKFHEELFKRN